MSALARVRVQIWNVPIPSLHLYPTCENTIVNPPHFLLLNSDIGYPHRKRTKPKTTKQYQKLKQSTSSTKNRTE